MAQPHLLVVIDDRGGRTLCAPDEAMVRIPGVGVLASERLFSNIGRKISIGDRAVLVLPASRRDRMEGLERGPQTIGPKDAAALIFASDISPDDVVVEAGAGSGWLSVALASAVGPRGRVIGYERRDDFASLARSNVLRARLAERVEIRIADIAAGIPERDVDAVILDVAEPWAIVPTAWDALRIGGSFGSFSPNVEQVRRTVEALGASLFVDVRTVEVLERELEVRETGTRPSQVPIGHTGYLTTARKCLEKFV